MAQGTVVAPVISAWASKINWTQVIAVLAMILTMFGFSLTAAEQADIAAAIIAIQSVVTIILRVFFSPGVTAPSAAKLP